MHKPDKIIFTNSNKDKCEQHSENSIISNYHNVNISYSNLHCGMRIKSQLHNALAHYVKRDLYCQVFMFNSVIKGACNNSCGTLALSDRQVSCNFI